MKRQVVSLEEIKKNRKPIRNINLEHKQNLSPLYRFAVWITAHVGTMGFFLIILIWTVSWLSWNVLGPKELQFCILAIYFKFDTDISYATYFDRSEYAGATRRGESGS